MGNTLFRFYDFFKLYIFLVNYPFNKYILNTILVIVTSLDLRSKCRIIFSSQVVGIQIKHADHEGKEDHDEDDHEFKNILHRAPKRYL